MRSCYVATVPQRADDLFCAWHSTTRHEGLDFSTDRGHGLGLKGVRAGAGRAEQEHGTVEFVARYKAGGTTHRLNEIGRWVRAAGRWVSLNAEVTFRSGGRFSRGRCAFKASRRGMNAGSIPLRRSLRTAPG